MLKRHEARIILYSIILVGIVFFLRYKREVQLRLPVTGISIEEVESIGPWWISVPAAENSYIETDIYGTFLEDSNTIHIIVPKEVNEKKIVFYVMDAADQCAIRYEGDFSKGDIRIGNKTVRCVKSSLPVVFLSIDKEQFDSMNADNDKAFDLTARGSVVAKERINADVTISPRGNATWVYPKKPYSLEFDNNVHLLGMSSNKKWNMLSNYCDLSILSNWVFLDLAERMGLPYTCEREMATVYINGNYKGVYLFTTKQNVGKNTIPLGKSDYLLLFGDPEIQTKTEEINYFSIDSNYIEDYGEFLETDYAQDNEPVATYKCFNIKYPKKNVDIAFIREFTQKAFSALENADSEEYMEYFDVDNLARFYLLQEFSHNDDAVARSIYLYYDSNREKLIFGPIWDMDSTLELTIKDPHELVANRSWYRSLFLHESFTNTLYDVYNSEVRDNIFESLAFFEDSASQMSIDGELNYKMVIGEYSQYFPEVRVFDNYKEQSDDKVREYKDRIEFLDELIISRKLGEYVLF